MNDTIEAESRAVVVHSQQFGALDSTGRKAAVDDLLNKVALVMEVMDKVMIDKEHYGTIPGCGDKKVLLKPGAEKLGMVFHFRPAFEVLEREYPNGHREYRITCILSDGTQGVGCCSTMEGKYRYRTGPKKLTDKPVPREYWNLRGTNPAKAQELLGGKGFGPAKNEAGAWMIGEQGEKVEHDNPADHYNTVLKMAKKRAHVDAIITATACSDLFTQDLEEIADLADASGAKKEEAPSPATPAQERPGTSAPASKPAPAAPASALDAKPTTAAAVREDAVKDKAWLDYFLKEAKRLNAEPYAWWIAKEDMMILPNEPLENISSTAVPRTRSASESFWNRVLELKKAGMNQEQAEAYDAAHLPGAPADPDDDQIPGAEAPKKPVEVPRDENCDPNAPDAPWRSFVMPWGKEKGKLLGDLDPKYVYGLWANFKVETEYDGKPRSEKQIATDTKLREMLDECGKHRNYEKKD